MESRLFNSQQVPSHINMRKHLHKKKKKKKNKQTNRKIPKLEESIMNF